MHLDLQTKYDELINSLPDGIIIIDSVGKIILANQAASSILGYSNPEELCKLAVDQLYANPGDHDSFLSILGHRGIAEKSLFEWHRKSGRVVLVEVSAMPLRDHQGHIGGIQAVFRDISGKLESQIARQETLAETAARSIDENKFLDAVNFYRTSPMSLILQGVAHNLNTPLGGIRGRAELLQHQIKKNDGLVNTVTNDQTKADLQTYIAKLNKGIGEIIAQVDKATLLIRGFAGKIAYEMNDNEMEIQINELIQNELAFLDSSLYFKHSITKNILLDPNVPMIKGVYRFYSQAIYSLLIHSMKATGHLAERSVTIKTAVQDGAILIEISDNRPPLSVTETSHHLNVNLTTLYENIPDEAKFSRYDIEIVNAYRLLAFQQAQLQVFPENEPKFIITIPKRP